MGQRISDKALLDLIEHIYAAALEPQEWHAVVSRLQAVHSACSFSLIAEADGQLLPITSVANIDPDFIKSYVEHYHTLNPYEAILANIPSGELRLVRDCVTRDWLEAQPFYHEWLKPAGNFTAGANITYIRTPHFYARTCIDIPDKYERLEPSAATFLERLKPHMSRALMLTAQTRLEQVTRSCVDTMLARITWPAFIVDGKGRILLSNEAAENLLAAPGVVKQLPDSRLAFQDAGAAEAYAKALTCLGPVLDGPLSSFVLRAPDGTPCPVHILPLAGQGSGAEHPARHALVMIGAGQRQPPSCAALLRALYNLTPAETALVQRLAAGELLADASDALGVARATARNQLASAMFKMDVNRQSSLIALMARLFPRIDAG